MPETGGEPSLESEVTLDKVKVQSSKVLGWVHLPGFTCGPFRRCSCRFGIDIYNSYECIIMETTYGMVAFPPLFSRVTR